MDATLASKFLSLKNVDASLDDKMYNFGVTLTLTSDLIYIIILSEHISYII